MKEIEKGKQKGFASRELSNYDNHPGELGTELFELEQTKGFKISKENTVKEIDVAINKINKGSYGKCELCYKEIDEERLEVLPEVRFCRVCMSAKDSNPDLLKKSRPVEEEVMNAPFGRKYLNEQDDDEHEGLDQLHDVMKYGSASTPQDMGGYHEYKEYYTNKVDYQGIVDPIEQVSNDEYKSQLPD